MMGHSHHHHRRVKYREEQQLAIPSIKNAAVSRRTALYMLRKRALIRLQLRSNFFFFFVIKGLDFIMDELSSIGSRSYVRKKKKHLI